MIRSSSLSQYFHGAAGKYLSEVEVHPAVSRQHEFNGVAALRELLGEPQGGRRILAATFVFIDDEDAPLIIDGTLTWYDARAKHPTRSECRLYYPTNPVIDRALPGDYMLIAVPAPGVMAAEVIVVISPRGASVSAQLQILFGLEPSERLDLEILPGDTELSYTSRLLLEALGIDAVAMQEERLGILVSRFGDGFPDTEQFSALARELSPSVDALGDPDRALLAWMDEEESLYRTFEHHLVADRLRGAAGEVEVTLAIAMQTFQRRRSRAGHALENHVAQLLELHGVEFERQAVTEGRKRPDFLFPGAQAYHDLTRSPDNLAMLATKTTCRDRWRQVVTEADRISCKHLLTLESPVSSAQLMEMRTQRVQLVVPGPLHDNFAPSDAAELMNIAEFIAWAAAH